MSEIRATTISDLAGTGPATLTGQSAAKAWSVWDASSGTPTAFQSFNVSSLTDTAAGRCVVNYTNSMSNTDNVISGGVGQGGAKLFLYDNNSATSVEIQTQTADTPTYTDYNNVSALSHGDLA